VEAIADDLTEDGLVLRYRVDSTDTGFEGQEGTFTMPRSVRRNGPATCARSCCPSPARCTSTPRRSTPAPANTWGTSPRHSPTSP
jgi:hypothetical protein